MAQQLSIYQLLLPTLLVFASACLLTDPDNLPPQVVIVAPSNAASFFVGDTIEIVAEASDSDGVVASVRFLVDQFEIGVDSTSPYSILWNTVDEDRLSRRLMAEAFDNHGASSTHSVSVSTGWVYTPPEQADDGWETATLGSVGLDSVPFVSMMNGLRSHDDHRTHGILIARNGRLVFEEYFDGYRRDDQNSPIRFGRDVVHDLASATKSFTSALLGIAIERGLIGAVEQQVSEFFPEFEWMASGQKADITLEHMITMSSGIQWDQATYAPLDPRNDLILFGQSADPWYWYLSRPLMAVPGTSMNYSEASINVVGEAIRRSSGMRLDEFADDYLFGPLGISVRRWGVNWGGWVWSSGDVFLQPRDMLKFGQLYLQGGEWNGEQIVPSAWVSGASVPYHVFDSTSMPHEQFWAATADMPGYSYAWWTLAPESYGANAFTANGWGDQRIMVLPEVDMVAVFTGGSQWQAPLMTSHEMMIRYVLPSVQSNPIVAAAPPARRPAN